jgi:hypothetical protein
LVLTGERHDAGGNPESAIGALSDQIAVAERCQRSHRHGPVDIEMISRLLHGDPVSGLGDKLEYVEPAQQGLGARRMG